MDWRQGQGCGALLGDTIQLAAAGDEGQGGFSTLNIFEWILVKADPKQTLDRAKE